MVASDSATGVISVPASIQPPGSSRQAAFVGEYGVLHFSAQEFLSKSSASEGALDAGLLSSAITAAFSTSNRPGPWSAETYQASVNLPTFGPNLGTRYLVKAVVDSLTFMYAD